MPGRLASLFLLAMLSGIAFPAHAASEPPDPLVTAAICTREYRPVCARLGKARKTYSNACMAKAAGARILMEGKCRSR